MQRASSKIWTQLIEPILNDVWLNNHTINILKKKKKKKKIRRDYSGAGIWGDFGRHWFSTKFFAFKDLHAACKRNWVGLKIFLSNFSRHKVSGVDDTYFAGSENSDQSSGRNVNENEAGNKAKRSVCGGEEEEKARFRLIFFLSSLILLNAYNILFDERHFLPTNTS